MELTLTEDQEHFVRAAIQSGRLPSEEEAGREAMSMWEERERLRLEIVASVESARTSYARGEGRMIRTDEDAARMIADIKRRGMARLKMEQTAGQ